jgi:PilZ domain
MTFQSRWHYTCYTTYFMGLNSVPGPPPEGIKPRARERRKHPRFDMHFSVLLRVIGESWMSSETIEVSAIGASLVTNRPFLLNTSVEYVLTLPPDLTKAPGPIRVRFFGEVLRCERIDHDNATFGVVVRNTSHRYLSRNEAAVFEELEQSRRFSVKGAG